MNRRPHDGSSLPPRVHVPPLGNWASPESVRATLHEVGAAELDLREGIAAVEALLASNPRAALDDWDARFLAWRRLPTSPILPEDECEPWNAAFTTRTLADVKRSFRSCDRYLVVIGGSGGGGP